MAVFKKTNRLTPNPHILNATEDASTTLPLGDNIFRNPSQFSPKGTWTDYFDDTTTEDDQRIIKIIMKLEEPFQNSNGSWAQRSEVDTRNVLLRKRKIRWSISFYVPSRIVGSVEKNIMGGINTQWHPNGVNSFTSPFFTFILEEERIRIRTRWAATGFTTGYMWFDLGPLTRNTWHHFEMFHFFTDNISLGRTTVFHNGEVAKLHNPETGNPWTVPISATSGISNLYIAYPEKGSLPAVASGVSLLDWFGSTFYPISDANIQNYFKAGFYKSDGVGSLYDSSGNPVNTTDPNGANYIEPDSYREIWFKNLKFAEQETADNESDEAIYRELNINGDAPTLDPELHSWFTFSDPVDPEPTPYTITLRAELENGTLGGGTAEFTNPTPPETYAAGAIVEVLATPLTGYEFLRWERGGTTLSTSALYNYTVPEFDSVLRAVFRLIPTSPSGKIKFRGRFAQQL